MNNGYEINQINSDTWRIEEERVRFFLLMGTEKALLIDSGMMVHNAKEIAQSLTDLPVELLNTHADVDHIGSNFEFEKVYMSPAEMSNYHNTQRKMGDVIPVWDGDILDLGGRQLEVIAMPGHTPGSIAVVDKKYRTLISGDPVQDGEIFMFGVQRELCAYHHSLVRLKTMQEKFDTIYPSHGSFPVGKDMIDQLITASKGILEGRYQHRDAEFRGMPLKCYDVGAAKFLCDGDSGRG